MRNSSHVSGWRRFAAAGVAVGVAIATLGATLPALADDAAAGDNALAADAPQLGPIQPAPLGDLTEGNAPAPTSRLIFDRGHADAISTRLEDGQLKLISRVDQPGELGKVFPADNVRFWINDVARTTLRNDFSPAGAAGETIWLVHQSGMLPTALWPGFSTELVPAGALETPTTFTLDKVEGPADFRLVLLTDDLAAGRQIWWHVSQQGTVKNQFSLGRQHAHSYWAFSKPGEYKLTVTASARIGGQESSDTKTYHFVVGPQLPAAQQVSLSLRGQSALVGETISYTATVEPAAAGYVEFYSGEELIGHKAVVNGTATYSFQSPDLGRYSVSARFVPARSDQFQAAEAAKVEVFSRVLTRLSGPSRYATSAALLEAGNWASDYVVLASGEGFADALASTPLAGALRAPVLLTNSKRLETETAKALRFSHDGGVRKAILVGGTVSISPAVEEAVRGAGFEVERLAGPSRTATAVEVSKRIEKILTGRGQKVNQIMLVDGSNYPDALSAGPIAAANHGVLLLSTGAKLSSETLAQAKALGAPITAVGAAARAAGNLTQDKVVGADRYQTSVLLAERFLPGTPIVVLAAGNGFADALSAGAFASLERGIVLLTSPAKLPAEAVTLLGKGAVEFTVLVGGPKSITPAVADEVKRLIR
ncbi:cell wall-binding repeat-containing protein [Buchananella felis]|uniref:cell wall-binding repeat-containing protein n=1 Tax=Buchananella felis TaxID=3231492 RepID=UPI0035283D17